MSSDNNETKRIKTSDLNKKAKKTTKNSKNGKQKFKDKHPKAARAIKITLLVLVIVLIIGIGVLVGAFVGIFGDELKIDEATLVVGDENSTVYDADGNLIATLSGGTKRKSITLADMSEYLPKAYVAIEDERFYNHSGFDITRTGYAAVTYVLNGGKSSFGGSTITQQVIKNITKEKDNKALAGAIRKVKEISKAIQVEQYLSKDQILELYLNLIFVGGDDINGVELGSVYYFDKSAKDLSIAECAFMAGINHSPNAYKPFEDFSDEENPEAKKADMTEKIKKRTKTVLAKMLEVEYINQEQYAQANKEVDEGLKFQKGESASVTVDVSYVTEAAIDQILDQIQAENEDMERDMAEMYLYSSGLKIYTTQKTDIQTVLEEEIVKNKYFTESTYEKTNKETGKKETLPQYSTPSMVIQDHKTGHVLAAAAATGTKEERTAKTKLGYLNIPTEIEKQTGSSMKPIAVIAPGLETKTINAATVYNDMPTTFGTGANAWNPQDYDYPRGLITMRTAIEVSANIPHAKAITNIGTEVAVEFCKSVGLPDFTAEGASLALGGLDRGVSPAAMAAAYSAIANDGNYVSPIYYTKVTDSKGNVIYEPEQETRTVMSEQNAYIVQNILTQPVISGTATYCAIKGMDVAAKTGTSNGSVDRWLCGFTEYYTAAAWYGYEYNSRVKGVSGNPAGNLWDAVMTEIHTELEKVKFEEPEGIIKRTVCRVSGKIASPACGANIYTEVFTEDNAPSGTCEGHGQIRMCNDSKQLATDLCPNVTETVGYIPEKERNATWVTQAGVQTDITMTCPLHGGGAPINAGGQPPPAQPVQPTQPTPQPEPQPQHQHNYKEIGTPTAATCTTPGSKTLKCDCGATKYDEIKPLGHSFGEWKTTVQPTTTTTGTKERVCVRCNKEKQTETVPMKKEEHKHSYTEKVSETPATCTAAGSAVVKCSCGETKTNSINALGHSFGEWAVTVQPTTTTEGTKTRTCTRCSIAETATVPTIPAPPSTDPTTPPDDNN